MVLDAKGSDDPYWSLLDSTLEHTRAPRDTFLGFAYALHLEGGNITHRYYDIVHAYSKFLRENDPTYNTQTTEIHMEV
jgi:hypothetical protein